MHQRLLPVILLLVASAAFGQMKAIVITETGKQHEVTFLRMRNDTIHVRARGSTGKEFEIAGHKSKYKKVTFEDGSVLDLTLSDYPPKEPSLWGGDTGSARGNAAVKEVAPSDTARAAQPVPDTRPSPQEEAKRRADSIALAEMAARAVASPPAIAQQPNAPATPAVAFVASPPAKHAATPSRGHWKLVTAVYTAAIASLAGSGIEYFLSRGDYRTAVDARDYLRRSVVPGPAYYQMVDVNTSKTRAANRELTAAAVLLGAGLAGIGLTVAVHF